MSEKIVYELDLDSLKFTRAVDAAKKSVQDVGSSGAKGFKDLNLTIGSLVKTAGLVGGAFFAASKAVDLVIKGEEINKMNAQFEYLAKNAGVSASIIKKGFLEAAEGEISAVRATELLNKAVSQLGASSRQIPELMKIAKGASDVVGGSAEEMFQKITNALATGRTQMLKQIGIFVDADKVVKDYAKTLGVAAGALTESDKRQAIMNAAIEKGTNKFKDLNNEVDPAKKSLEGLKSTFADLFGTIAQLTAKAGGALSGFFDFITSRAKTVNSMLRSAFDLKPDTVEEATQRINDLKFSIMKLQEQADKEKSATGRVSDSISAQIAKRTEELNKARADLEQVAQKETAGKSPDGDWASEEEENRKLRLEKQKEFNQKYTQELLASKDRNLQLEMNAAQSEEEIARITSEKKNNIIQQYELQRQQLDSNDSLTREQKNNLEIEMERNKNLQLMAIDQEMFDYKQRALDNYLNASQDTATGFARAFEVGSKKAALELSRGVELGKRSFDSLGTNAAQAFMDIGSGAKSGADALRGFMFGAIGDIAQAFGQQILLASIFPPNPAGLAAGGALLALAGFLKSQSSGSKLGEASMGTGSISGFGTNPETVDLQEKQEKKTATIIVQGNYFETEQSRQRITEMVRESGDFTDFKVQSIGLGS